MRRVETRISTPSLNGARRLTPGGRQANVSGYPAHPILKPAPWTWMIPTYFLLGGIAGAAATIAGVAEMAGSRRLASRSRLAALLALAPCPPLLILDLGRPERFLNMLRVFRPTSPMNLGTWVLTIFGGALSASAVFALIPWARPLGRLGGAVATLLGPVLSTYTGVLLSNTSTPAWHRARRYLPALFAAGAAASGGAASCLLTPAADAGPARKVAVAGAMAEVAVARMMERGSGDAASAYAEGKPAIFAKLSTACSLAGAATLGFLGRRRPGAIAGSLLLIAAAGLERFAVCEAGVRSAKLT